MDQSTYMDYPEFCSPIWYEIVKDNWTARDELWIQDTQYGSL